MLRATLPAPPMMISLRFDRDHRRRRFRRHARDVAIDEFVEHQVADAQHASWSGACLSASSRLNMRRSMTQR